jgi:type I restriction enzyme R subunit
MDIIKTALPKFIEKLDVCRDLMHGYDYSAFMSSASDLTRAKTISGGVDFFSSPERDATKETFIKEALLLRQATTLCHSRLDEKQRFEAAYFEAVRTLLTRVGGQGKLSFKELNEAINELLKQSIHSEGVINLFSDIHEEFSIFDPNFLAEIAQMKERNLAVEMLKKLIAEQISIYKRTNVVKSEKFSEMMMQSMSNYLKGLLTNEQVIEELLKMAQDIANSHKEGEEMGLNSEEMAFYDALTKPGAVRDFYDNDQLVAITKELTDTLRRNKTIDWQKKEGARAGMRMIVKRLLRKYDYPPEGVDDAINTVIAQCEMWSDNN